MRTAVRLTLVATSCLVLTGCSREAEPPPPPITTAPRPTPTVAATAPAAATMARATLTALNGSGVTGEVTFTDTGNGVSIEAHVNGLTPGSHGFHVHEVGDCSGDGTAAGEHFNPTASAHGGPDGEVLHAGDMGNLVADASGHGMVTMVSRHVSLQEGAANSIIGRSVIVHANPDDLTSQPSGNAGARVACGRIELSTGGATGAMGTTAPGGLTGTEGMGTTGGMTSPAGMTAGGTTAPAGATAP